MPSDVPNANTEHRSAFLVEIEAPAALKGQILWEIHEKSELKQRLYGLFFFQISIKQTTN